MTIDTDGTYIITQTNPETPTTNTITVSPGVTATVTLKDVNIDATNNSKCAFDMHGESENKKTTVTLLLEGSNTLNSGGRYAGIYTGQYGVLTIGGTGSLSVKGAYSAAAIGGSAYSIISSAWTKAAHGGTIRINGGSITATPGQFGAAIGDGDYDGLSGSKQEGSASVTITGGTITIPSVSGAVGCLGYGGDTNSKFGSVIITGGTINFPSGKMNDNKYIRSGNVIIGPDVTIKKMSSDTGSETVSIDDTELRNNLQQEKGFVFSNNTAEIKGDVTLPENMQIPQDADLTIPEGTSLTIPDDVTLTNNGTIYNGGTITGNVDSNGTGTILTILTESMITLSQLAFDYDGTEKKPTVTVQKGSDTFVENRDYTVSYDNNTNAAEFTATNAPKVKVTPETGSKLFGDGISKTFTIKKANPTATNFTFTAPTGDLTYDGQSKMATIATVEGITGMGSYTVKYAKDGETESTEAPIDAGTYTIKIDVADGTNYNAATGLTDTNWKFTISKANPTITLDVPTEDALVYDGTAKEATVSVSGVNNETLAATATLSYQKKTGGVWVDLSGDEKPKDVGFYKVTAKYAGNDNYKEEEDSDEFTITAKKLTTEMVSLSQTSFTYTGNEQKPDVTVKDGTTDLVENTDYTLTWPTGCTDAGTYTVRVTGKGNYTSVISKNYTIDKYTPAITLTVPAVSDLVYNGTAKEATVSVSGVAGETLSATLSYEKKTGDDTWGALQEGNKPTDVGAYRVTAKFDGNTNYNPAEPQTETYTITPANAELAFAQTTLTMTKGNAVPANALTNPHTCAVTYTSSEPTVATVNAETGEVTVVGVGTTTITATAQGNYAGEASYTLKVNRYIPPYYPPSDPVYYTVTIPTEVTGAIIHGGGTHEVEEYTYYTFRIELDPNGNGEYPTVTKGYWWDTLTPDGQGNYRVYVTGNTQITIGEVPTNSYTYYQVTLPTDSVTEAENQYWSGDYIEVIGASPLRAAEEASISYQAPFGATVTLRPIETERRKFLMWEDGSTRKERTLTLRADQEIKALWKRISPTGIEAIADGSVIRGERGQLYIEVPEPCDVTLYTYGGVPVRVARLAAGANRLANLNAGLYLVKIGAAPAVPVRIR